MPEVVRGSRSVDLHRNIDLTSPTSPSARGRVSFAQDIPSSPLGRTGSGTPLSPATSESQSRHRRERRESIRRHEEDAYYDSRAATKKEFKRRASTLQEYYKQNPALLPQLPFTLRHGWRRWKLALLVTLAVIDACVMPIVFYYAMFYAGHVQGWIIFAIVTTIWGGPTYGEFASRSWRLIKKKQDFYRPLGTTSRWCFDATHYVFILTIIAVTALFIVGSAPHVVWLRVLSMPGPAILYTMGGCMFIQTMWSISGRKAPFRVSSTPKGGLVKPGVYTFVEDIVAVNGNAGRPFREALAARYDASPIFRRMILHLSLFWSVSSLVVAIVLTVVICIHEVSDPVAYGVGWAVPFIWAGIWTAITVLWVRREMHEETESWELDQGIVTSDKNTHGIDKDLESANGTVSSSDADKDLTAAADDQHDTALSDGNSNDNKKDAELSNDAPNGTLSLNAAVQLHTPTPQAPKQTETETETAGA